MRPLSSHEIVKVWEMAQDQPPQERALALLSVACPDMTHDELAGLSIAQTDALFLNLREETFGQNLSGFAECPHCRERLEFKMTTGDIRGRPNSEPVEKEYSFELPEEDLSLRFRLPTSLDLSLVAGCGNVQEARGLLVKRCVSQVRRQGAPVPVEELPGEVIHRLAERMAECAPQSEVLLDLHCPRCHHHWQILFDIAAFLWTEVTTQAKRLLREVHALASAYGWREGDILSMSHVRRQFYLEMVNS